MKKDINDVILQNKNSQNWLDNLITELFKDVVKKDIEDLKNKISMIQNLREFGIMNDEIAVSVIINLRRAIEFIEKENIVETYEFKTFTDSSEEYALESITISIPKDEMIQRRNPKLKDIKRIYLLKDEIEEIKNYFEIY